MKSFKDSRVTVLDDDRSVCESLIAIIQSWGLCVEGFTRPEAALENIGSIECDLILLDILSSDVCGPDLLLQLSGDVKIIVMTGRADKSTALRALGLGAFDFLEKPFENELLYHSIWRALTALENERASKRLIADLEKSRSELLTQQQRLESLNTQLFDTNRALSVFAQNVERGRDETEKQIASKLRSMILPMVMRLRNDQGLHKYQARLDTLISQIEDVTSGFPIDSRVAMTLSSAQLRVASLVKNGVSTEEIARQLHVSESTVRTQRKNIRKKLKINSAQFSLKNFLNSRV